MKELISQVEKITFKNGFTLILFPRPDSALLAVNLGMNLGNLFEKEEQRGISALMQESLLKGTQRQSAVDFNRAVENLGAVIDSSSGYFTGRVVIRGPALNGEQMLQLFFEAVKSPAFREEEIEKERAFLVNVLRSLDDDPFQAAMLRFKRAFYGRHPYAFSTLGEEETLSRLGEEEVWSWYRRTYVPNNMVVAVVGNFDSDEMIKIFEREMGEIIPRELVSPYSEGFSPTSLKIVSRKKVRDSWIVMGFKAPGLLEEKERVVFDILNNILGGGAYSRLFLKIREEQGLSYQVGSVYAPLRGPSFICAYASFPHIYFDRVTGVLREEFRRLSNLEKEEFEEAKNYTRGSFLHSLETVSSLSSLLAFFEKVGLGWDFIFRYEEMLQTVSLPEAKAIYQQFSGQGESMGGVVPAE